LEENEDRLKEELKLELKKKPSFELEDVKNILNYNINEIETLEKINHYYKDIEQTSKLIENEKANIDSQSVLVEEKDSILEKLNTNNKELQILNERIGELKSKKQVLEEGLKRKRELESEREALENKKDRVETLKKLFEKKGFVNYVSTLYLEDLCESANERFFVFTSNRLRLELNEKNEIHVRDLYHDGNYRHIKTLSGGQLFQASLAMALALSDRIQTASGVSERFFFLDEGFGSLDKESLAVVFETLKSLRKENRIVGLISHVEEMKSEIRTYLSVTNRPGMGTSVRGNWERTGN
jgi:exonuclease SbcC